MVIKFVPRDESTEAVAYDMPFVPRIGDTILAADVPGLTEQGDSKYFEVADVRIGIGLTTGPAGNKSVRYEGVIAVLEESGDLREVREECPVLLTKDAVAKAAGEGWRDGMADLKPSGIYECGFSDAVKWMLRTMMHLSPGGVIENVGALYGEMGLYSEDRSL